MKKITFIVAMTLAMFSYTAKAVLEPAPSYTKKIKIEITTQVNEIRIG